MVHLLAICVLTSASASTQTTILPTARTSLSMAASGHPQAVRTDPAEVPHALGLDALDRGGVSIIFYIGLTLISNDILADTIAAVGLMIAFYYGLTGFACVWFYRETMWAKPRDILMQGLLPLLGGILLVGFFFKACWTYADPEYGYTSIGSIGGVFLIGVRSLLLGLVLMFIYQGIAPAYFRGETLPERDSGDLVLVGSSERPVGVQLRTVVSETVIAPRPCPTCLMARTPSTQPPVSASTGRPAGRGLITRRTLILLRHAKSDWSGGEPDRLQPLAPRGRRQAPEAGQWLADHAGVIDLAVVSTAARAQQTWQLAAADSLILLRSATRTACTPPPSASWSTSSVSFLATLTPW